MRQRLQGCVLFLAGTTGCSDFVGADSVTSSGGAMSEASAGTGDVEASGSTSSTPGTTSAATAATASSDSSDSVADDTTASTTVSDIGTITTTSADPSSSGDPPPACDNETLDPGETDVDCGGPCQRCGIGKDCSGGTDCDTAFCTVDLTCGLQEPVVWLDARDESTLFADAACTTSPPTDGQQVYCWSNKGSAAGRFVDDNSQPNYRPNDDGLEFGDDLLVSEAAIFTGDLDDVTVFVVQEEVSSRDSFDFNLNHPSQMPMSRYSTHIPWGSSRRVVFDIGGIGSERISTMPDVIDEGETHLFAFVNSAEENARMIRIDGSERASGNGNRSSAASVISIGSGAYILVHEFRVYTPSPSEADREVIEGQLACTWGLRDELPAGHPFHADDGEDQTGCPPPLD